eukprot:g29234.t1
MRNDYETGDATLEDEESVDTGTEASLQLEPDDSNYANSSHVRRPPRLCSEELQRLDELLPALTREEVGADSSVDSTKRLLGRALGRKFQNLTQVASLKRRAVSSGGTRRQRVAKKPSAMQSSHALAVDATVSSPGNDSSVDISVESIEEPPQPRDLIGEVTEWVTNMTLVVWRVGLRESEPSGLADKVRFPKKDRGRQGTVLRPEPRRRAFG